MSKTPRMAQIEALLELEPTDAFLQYGLAMEYVSVGDDTTAASLLTDLVASKPDDPYVPAFLMAGQAYQRLGRDTEACAILKKGIAAATKAGNDHARGEMEGLLASIE
jgi:predicted Zn-dependent protease